MSNFLFLKSEWPDLHEAAARAEALVYVDSRALRCNMLPLLEILRPFLNR
jgi:hypothetical protein